MCATIKTIRFWLELIDTSDILKSRDIVIPLILFFNIVAYCLFYVYIYIIRQISGSAVNSYKSKMKM